MNALYRSEYLILAKEQLRRTETAELRFFVTEARYKMADHKRNEDIR
jgi:hypothetical protein